MDSLYKIFQSENGEIRLKVLRFFLANQNESFKLDTIEKQTKIKKLNLRKDITFLCNAGFLEKDNNKNVVHYKLSPNFENTETLYDLVFDFQSLDKKFITDKLKKIGRIKLLTFTGVFIPESDVDLDVLVVGDNLKQKEMAKVVAELNSIFASKLRVLIMDIEEFDYRYKMFDRFLHLILDGKRIDAVDKLSNTL